MLSVGDQVLLRGNYYRGERARGEHEDVLNGFRGIVRAVDEERRVLVEWRKKTAGGHRDVTECHGVTHTAAVSDRDRSGDCSCAGGGQCLDAVEDVGGAAVAPVGAQVLSCGGHAALGAGGVEGEVDVEEGLPVR